MLCCLLTTLFMLIGNNINPEITPIEEVKSEDSDTILKKVGLGRKNAIVPSNLAFSPAENKTKNSTNLAEKIASDGSLLDIRFAELEDTFDKEDESKRDDLAGQLILNTLNTFEQLGINLEDVD